MKTGIEIANNFTYVYKNIDYMKDHDNFDLFNKIVEGDLLEKGQANRYYGIEKIAYLE